MEYIMDNYGRHSRIVKNMIRRRNKLKKLWSDLVSDDAIDRVVNHQPLRDIPTDEELRNTVDSYLNMDVETVSDYIEEDNLFPFD